MFFFRRLVIQSPTQGCNFLALHRKFHYVQNLLKNCLHTVYSSNKTLLMCFIIVYFFFASLLLFFLFRKTCSEDIYQLAPCKGQKGLFENCVLSKISECCIKSALLNFKFLLQMWEIPPYHTKNVMKANFVARAESNHTAYIR